MMAVDGSLLILLWRFSFCSKVKVRVKVFIFLREMHLLLRRSYLMNPIK